MRAQSIHCNLGQQIAFEQMKYIKFSLEYFWGSSIDANQKFNEKKMKKKTIIFNVHFACICTFI